VPSRALPIMQKERLAMVDVGRGKLRRVSASRPKTRRARTTNSRSIGCRLWKNKLKRGKEKTGVSARAPAP